MISGLLELCTEDAYTRARKILKERFGNPFKIYKAYGDKLKNWSPCVTSAELQEFGDFLVMAQETMRTVKCLWGIESHSMIQQLAVRLLTYYSNKWRESAKKKEERCGKYSFENFVEFIQEASLDANHPVFSHDALNSTRRGLDKERSSPAERAKWSPKRRDKKRRYGLSSAFSIVANEFPPKAPKNTSSCALCKGRHILATSKAFLEKPFKGRQDLCMTRGICFTCLNPGHMARHCRRKTQCEVCKKPHTTILRRFLPEEKNENSAQETVRATNNCVNCSDTTISMIFPVWIHHKDDPERRVELYAVLDDQSDTCFITDNAVNDLEITGPAIKIELGTMHAAENIDEKRTDGLLVSRFDGKAEILLPKACARGHIPGLRGQILRPETARKHEHLKKRSDPTIQGKLVHQIVDWQQLRAHLKAKVYSP